MKNKKIKVFCINIVILGAGPAGLSAAWKLSKKHNVFVLEKENFVGGQAITIEKNGHFFDMGPHNFHTVYPEIESFVKEFLRQELKRIKVSSKILFRGKWVNYPLRGVDVFLSIDPFLAAHCLVDFLLTRAKLRLSKPKKEVSFEEWVTNRFGKKLYSVYFQPYASKVWGIPTSQLSKDCAEKRIPALSLFDLLKSTILRKKHFHPEDPTLIRNYYPSKGIGALCEKFAKEIKKNRGKIFIGSKIKSFNFEGKKVASVVFESKGKTIEQNCDFLLSTIPLSELALLAKEKMQDSNLSLSKCLSFRGERLLFVGVKRPSIFGLPWVYFSGDVPFNRIYETTSFSKEASPEGETGLCIEFTCSEKDALWKRSDEGLFKRFIKEMESRKLLSRREIIFFFSKKLRHAYPIYTVDYKEKLKKIFGNLENIKNLVTFGRLGLFCYANVDEVIKMGFEAAEFVSKNKKPSYKQMFPKFILY